MDLLGKSLPNDLDGGARGSDTSRPLLGTRTKSSTLTRRTSVQLLMVDKCVVWPAWCGPLRVASMVWPVWCGRCGVAGGVWPVWGIGKQSLYQTYHIMRNVAGFRLVHIEWAM